MFVRSMLPSWEMKIVTHGPASSSCIRERDI
jgi:hypothetical protein